MDLCGNSSTCEFIITVNDTTGPSISGPLDLTVSCADDVPLADLGSISATDNCGGVPIITVAADVTSEIICVNGFIITRAYIATDVCGNTAIYEQEITVQDTVPPSITCPEDLTVTCSEDIPEADVSIIVSVDNCSVGLEVEVTESVVDLVCANQYTLLRTFTTVDECGNTGVCTQTIVVSDTTAPVITCLEDITVECAEDIPLPDIDLIVASDNCDLLVSVSVAVDDTTSFTGANLYTILRVYTAVDSCGNSSTCAQTITVSDTTAPVIV